MGNLKKHQTWCSPVPLYKPLKARLCHLTEHIRKGRKLLVRSGTMHDSAGTVCTPPMAPMLNMVASSIVTYGFKIKSQRSHFMDTEHILKKKVSKTSGKKQMWERLWKLEACSVQLKPQPADFESLCRLLKSKLPRWHVFHSSPPHSLSSV